MLPVSCVSPFDYITCQPAVDGACPTRSCKYTATRCTYVPNMPLQTLLLSGYDLTILPETFGHTMSVLERLHLTTPDAKGAPTPGVKETDYYETEEQRELAGLNIRRTSNYFCNTRSY